MGLVDILSKKLKRVKCCVKTLFAKPIKEFVFQDLNKNFYKNQKLYLEKWNSILRDANVILRRKGIECYLPDYEDSVDELTLDAMEITNSENYSCNFANLVSSVKLYAANYLVTDRGKSDKEIKVAIAQLSNIIDCLNFNLVAHINNETIYNMEIVDGQSHIYLLTDAQNINYNDLIKDKIYPYKILTMQNRVVYEILKAAEGIFNKNNTSVYQAFSNLCGKDLYNIDDITFEISEVSENVQNSNENV